MNGAAGRRSVLRENLGTFYVNHISVYRAVVPVLSALLTPRYVNYFVNFSSVQATGHRFQPSRFRSLDGAAEDHPPSMELCGDGAVRFFVFHTSLFHWHSSIVKFGFLTKARKQRKLLLDDGKIPFSCRLWAVARCLKNRSRIEANPLAGLRFLFRRQAKSLS